MIRRILSFLPFVLIVTASYVTKEFYPLSSFPMYSKFDAYTYVSYLQDENGEALATIPATGMYASELKKRYSSELKTVKKEKGYKGSHYDWTVEQKTEAGDATLAYLKEFEKVPENVRLVDLRIFLKDGKIVKEESVVSSSPNQ